MTIAHINGVELNYEVHGVDGPWVALMPGGRLGLGDIRSLAGRIAAAGYRVLIQDRRNCGASEVSIDGAGAEHEIWADDLHALLQSLHALPAYVGGCSSGARLTIDFALRYPEAVRGLLLWRVTGGAFAVKRLCEKYYGEYIRAATSGGMAAIAQTEHFSEVIAARPKNRDKLLAMDPATFIAAMRAWETQFQTGVDQPVIGASEAQLRAIKVPACVVPGNDKTHPAAAAEALARLMPNAEFHPLMGPDLDLDVDPHEHWDAKEEMLAEILLGSLARMRKQAG